MDQPGPTKSTRNRVVGLSLTALNNLKAMFEMAIERNPEDFVFTREGTFINPEYFSKWISGPLLRRVSKNGARFHDMRHFYASMLIAQGESPKYIQDQLGHASITTTFDIYGHLINKSKPEVAARLEKSVFGPNVRSLLEEVPAEGVPEKVN
jgi:integrase